MLLLTAASAGADAIAVREVARVSTDRITLADVARLSGPGAEALAGLDLGAVGESGSWIGLKEIRRRVDEHGANWGVLTLRGPVKVRVERVPATAEPSGPVAGDSGGRVWVNPTHAIEIAGVGPAAPTIGGRLRAWLMDRAGAHTGKVTVDFSEADAGFCAAPVGRDRITFEPVGKATLGRIPVAVRRYRPDGSVDSQNVQATVALRCGAVVATRPIGRGKIITAADVELREVEVTSSMVSPVAELAEAIGRQARGAIAKGSVVQSDKLEDPELVARGETVAVRCLSGGLVLRTTARAMEPGRAGQWILLRNEVNRKTFRGRVTGPQQVLVVIGGSAEGQKP